MNTDRLLRIAIASAEDIDALLVFAALGDPFRIGIAQDTAKENGNILLERRIIRRYRNYALRRHQSRNPKARNQAST